MKTKWVFSTKKDTDRNVIRYKARLVAGGFSQIFGQDYSEVFSAVVRFESVRLLCALAVQRNYKVHVMDFTTAFLNGILKEEIYCSQPPGLVNPEVPKKVLKLNKSLYGLHQAPRAWNFALHSHLKQSGFKSLASDSCLYIKEGAHSVMLCLYVNDIALACEDEDILTQTKLDIGDKFKVKDLGRINEYLGVTITHNASFNEDVLEKSGMNHCKPVLTPMNHGTILVKAKEEEKECMVSEYRSILGGLLFLSNRTRPDLSFSVGVVSIFCSKPTETHWVAVKRILRYLSGTRNHGIMFKKEDIQEVISFSDSDFGGSVEDRRSTSGYVFKLASGPISWMSKKTTYCVLEYN